MNDPLKRKIFPVLLYRENILSVLKNFRVLIIVAETGSGKTIFVPQLLRESRLFTKIIVSQTRRISAISAARFLSKVLGFTLGKIIGYAVRFEELIGPKTEIKFVTDGILFQNMIRDPFSSEFSCLVIDEFHERTIHTDLLLALIKKMLSFQKNNKIILMSASGDSDKIANFFKKNVGKIKIPGKLFKTRVYYTKFAQKNFIISISATIVKLHSVEKIPGDILVFLPGQDELEEVGSYVYSVFLKNFQNFFILKLYANLPQEKQVAVLNPVSQGFRKIILSTNIAESSITIPGVSIVIDCGLSKQKISNWKTGINLLRIFPISKSEAVQRAGRSSREKNGKCFRLYQISDYLKLKNFPKPEINKIEITSVLLQLYCCKLNNLFEIDFLDFPPQWEIIRSLELLFAIGSIDFRVKITSLGKLISLFPLDVKLSKSIIEAIKEGSIKLIDWVLTTSSILSTNSMFDKETRQKKTRTVNPDSIKNLGDHYYLASLFFSFIKQKNSGKAFYWCRKLEIDQNSLEMANNIKKQLKKISEKVVPFFKKNFNLEKKIHSFYSSFCFCLVGGFFLNSAKIRKKTNKFRCIMSGLIAEPYPSSLVKKKLPSLVIFHEIFVTTRIFLRWITPVHFSWLFFFGHKIFK